MVGKFCTNCGEPIGDADRFCGSCRAALTKETIDSQTQIPEPAESKVSAVRSPFELALAVVLGASFFLPWFSYAGFFTIEGYRIPTLVRSIARIGQSIEEQPTKETWADLYYLLWAIPVLAALMGFRLYHGLKVKALQIGTGILVASPFVYLLIKAPSDSLRGLSFGAYLEMGAGLLCLGIGSGLVRPPQRGITWGRKDRVWLSVACVIVIGGLAATLVMQNRQQQDFADRLEMLGSDLSTELNTSPGSITQLPSGSDGATSTDSKSTSPASCESVGDAVTAAPDPVGIEGVKAFVGMSRKHVSGCVSYPQAPPVGGNHSEVWQGCKFYDGTIVKEQAVHSMEHGAVWITYRADVAAVDLEVLKAYNSNDRVLVSKWDASLPSPVVASAWGVQLELLSTADPRLDQFVQKYADGPQNPEPGIPCRDGGTMET